MKGVTIKILHFIRKIREEENEKWSHIQAQVESIALQQTENSRMYWVSDVVELESYSFILMSVSFNGYNNCCTNILLFLIVLHCYHNEQQLFPQTKHTVQKF